MNSLDIAIIAIILISTLVGLLRGITREIFSLLSIFCGIIGASRWYQKISPFFLSKINNEPLAQGISFIVVFLVISILISLIGIILGKIWRILHLTLFDRIFGAVFGIIRGLILIGLMIILIEKFPMTATEKFVQGSALFHLLFPLKDALLSLFPFSFLEK